MNCLNSIANQSLYEKDAKLISEGERVLAQFEQFYVEHDHAARIMNKLIEVAGRGKFSMPLSHSCSIGNYCLDILDIFGLGSCPVATTCRIEYDQIELLPKNIVGYYITTFNCDAEIYEVKRYFKRPETITCSCLNIKEVNCGYHFSYEVFLAYKIKELILKDGGNFSVSSKQEVEISWGKRNCVFNSKSKTKESQCSIERKEVLRVVLVIMCMITIIGISYFVLSGYTFSKIQLIGLLISISLFIILIYRSFK